MNYGFNADELIANLLRPGFIGQLFQQINFQEPRPYLHLVYVLAKLQTSSANARQNFIKENVVEIVQALLTAEQDWVIEQSVQSALIDTSSDYNPNHNPEHHTTSEQSINHSSDQDTDHLVDSTANNPASNPANSTTNKQVSIKTSNKVNSKVNNKANSNPTNTITTERRMGSRPVVFKTQRYGNFTVKYPRNRHKNFKSSLFNPKTLPAPFSLDDVLEYLIDLCAQAPTLDKLIYTFAECFKVQINSFIITRFLLRIAPLMKGWNNPRFAKNYIHGCCQKITINCAISPTQTIPYYIHLFLATNELNETQVLHISMEEFDNMELWEQVLKKLRQEITYITKIYTYHVGEQPTNIVDLAKSNHKKAVIVIDKTYIKSTTTTALTNIDEFHQKLKQYFNFSYFFYYG